MVVGEKLANRALPQLAVVPDDRGESKQADDGAQLVSATPEPLVVPRLAGHVREEVAQVHRDSASSILTYSAVARVSRSASTVTSKVERW